MEGVGFRPAEALSERPRTTRMNYSAAVLERVRDPKHAGWLPRDAPEVGTGEAGSIDSGTMTRIQIRVVAASQRIEEAVFKAVGCSAAIASASLVAERLQGATVSAARALEGFAICRGIAVADGARRRGRGGRRGRPGGD